MLHLRSERREGSQYHHARKAGPENETKGGWGCVVCGIEPFGAIAVLCDFCVDDFKNKKAEIKFACLGYPGANRRIEVAKLTETWKHVEAKHPEITAKYN